MPPSSFQFDPERVAHFEVEGWKAYYDRAWLRLLRLVVMLVQEQFHIPFPVSLLAAYYVIRASVAWVPKEHSETAVLTNLAAFYRLVRRCSGLNFNPRQVAALEARYWDDHRRLVGQADKSAFIKTLTDLHAALFGLSTEQAAPSGLLRVEANNLLDTITTHTSPNPAADWLRCEELLRQAYRSLRDQIRTPDYPSHAATST